MVEAMKITGTSFKRSPAGTAPLNAPGPRSSHTVYPRLRWRLLDTQGQVWVSPLWGHCSFLLGLGAYKVLFVPSKGLFPQPCVSSGSSMVGLISPRGLMPHPGLLHPEPPSLWQATADPYLLGRHLNTVQSQTLWVLVCTRFV